MYISKIKSKIHEYRQGKDQNKAIYNIWNIIFEEKMPIKAVIVDNLSEVYTFRKPPYLNSK